MRFGIRRRIERVLEAFFILAIGTVFVLVYSHNARGLTFFFDEWTFLTQRHLNVDGLLQPHNGHLSILPVATYLVLRRAFGLGSYVPYLVCGAAVHMSVAGVCYGIVRRTSVSIAMAILAPVLLLGSGWQNIMWPFQIGMMGSFLFGILAIDEAARPMPRRRLVVFVGLSLMCAGGGVAAAAVAGILLIIGRQWRRFFEFLSLMFLYGLWFVSYGESQSQPGNLALTPRYVLDSAVGAGAGTAGRSAVFGWIICGAAIATVMWKVARHRTEANTRLAVGLAGLLLCTWTLTGLSRAHLHEPQASRYVYVGAIMLLLILSIRSSPVTHLMAYGLPVVTWFVFVVPNLSILEAGSGGLRDTSQHVRAALTALDMSRVRPPSDAAVDSSRAPQLSVFSYDRISKSYGKAGFHREEIWNLADTYQADIDTMLNTVGLSPVRDVDGDQCGSKQVVLQGSVIVQSKMRLVLQSEAAIEIPLRRYSTETEIPAKVTVLAGSSIEISNLAQSSVKPLTLEIQSTGVRGCVLPVRD